MKKAFASILSLVLVLALMVGCGGTKVEESKAPESAAPESTAPESTAPESSEPDIAWPERTIQIVMPYKPGGDSDTYARLCAERLEKVLGVPVVIVNQNGANNTLAPQSVFSAEADGYNVLYYNSTMMTQEALGVFEELGFSITKDFTAACAIGIDNTYALMARSDSGWSTWTDVVKILKDAPDSVTFSMMYNGNTQYLELAMEEASGVQLKGIDVGSGTADRVVAMLGGQVDLIIGNLSSFTDYIEDGSMVCLGLYTNERNPFFPDIPTLAEQGCPVLCPKYYTFRFLNGTDQAIIDKFAAACEQVCQDPEYIEALGQYYAEATFTSGEDINEFDVQYAADQAEALANLG